MKLELKSKQSMVATMAMQQAFLVLQMPTYELAAWIQTQIDQNPILEYQERRGEAPLQTPIREVDFENQTFEILDDLDETFKGALFPEDRPIEKSKEVVLSYAISLFDHLMRQAKEVFSDSKDLALAELIIGNLDERGFLGDASADPSILKTIQTFDPPGIGARNLQDSLLIQLRIKGKECSIASYVIEHCFDALLHNRFLEIEKKTKIPIQKLQAELYQEIGCLDFHPGHRFHSFASPSLIPDVYLYKDDEKWQIRVNDTFLPKFHIAPPSLLSLKVEEHSYIRTHIAQGKWLLRTLKRRHETLKKIVAYLLKKQASFFNGQPHKLHPLTLNEAALELGLHESTVARAVADKYLSSPQGIFSLKSFFTPAFQRADGERISTRRAKDTIASLIQSENKQTPLSDEALTLALAKEGIPCARRTVTKYRKILNIPTACQRKRWDVG